MSGQLLVVALTLAGPLTLTLIVPEPPPAGIDNELSLTDNTQRPSLGLPTSRADGAVDAFVPAVTVAATAGPRRASASVIGFVSSTFALGASTPSVARSSAAPCVASCD